MAGYSDEQVRWFKTRADEMGAAIFGAKEKLRRIREIAKEHESCECSAALMILEVLDRG